VSKQRREEDPILNLIWRKWGIVLEQKLDSSHIKCSKMNIKDRKGGNEPGEIGSNVGAHSSS
jgi:hypothetical protein